MKGMRSDLRFPQNDIQNIQTIQKNKNRKFTLLFNHFTT